MIVVVRMALVLGCLASCGGPHYGYYPAPPPEYRHYHRLDCDHVVECRYDGGAHHFTPHRSHDRYWHVHRTDNGYKRCYVERRRHDY
jgi:hypothetical protein